MMKEQFNAEYYEKLYGKEGLDRFSSHWWAVRLYALIADKWLRRIGGRKFLEIGCGHGFVLARLAERYETYGLDLSDYATEQCARFTPTSCCHSGDIEEGIPQQFQGMQFDLVMAKYVFEHLKAPDKALSTVREMLRPGGLIFFSVPNLDCPGRRLKGQEWYAYKDPTHISLLPPDEWLRLVEAAGYRIRSTFSDGYWDLPYFANIPKFLQLPLLAPSALVCLTGWEVLPAKMGENLMIVAEKV
jgi:SAM-dependent methyltransferase